MEISNQTSYKKISIPKLSFLKKSIYITKNVKEQLSTSTNLYLNSSIIKNNKNSKKNIINKINIKNLILNSNSYSKKNSPIKVISNSYSLNPGINDREKLGSYYKLNEDEYYYKKEKNNKNSISLRKQLSKNKLEKKKLFSKYHILNDSSFENSLPKINDSEISTKIVKTYFTSITKANKTIAINKQLVLRMNDITNYFLLEKYNNNINKLQKTEYLIKKMPKINIKNIKSDKDILDINIIEKEKSKSISKNKTNNISIGIFKKLSFNGMLAVNENEIQKKKKKNIIHEVNIIISDIKLAYKPNSRMDFSLNKYENKVFLFGGLNSNYLNDIWEYNLLNNKWEKITFNKKIDFNLPNPRFGHSSIIIDKYLVIYGGLTLNINEEEEIILFDLENYIFSYPKIKNKFEFPIRKNHICISSTKQMLIQGGITIKNNEIQNTGFIFDITKNQYFKLETTGKKLPYLINHSAVMVNNFQKYSNKSFSFYKIPIDLASNRINKIQIEGIYIFGGLNKEKKLKNDIYIISIGKKPCNVLTPIIDGIPPEERMNCKMEFILDYDFIIIHGGIGKNDFIYWDIMILNTECLNWIKPIFDKENFRELESRTEHGLFFYQGKIFILGGRNEDRLLNMDFEIVQFEVTGF